jgi:hypothetical protein
VAAAYIAVGKHPGESSFGRCLEDRASTASGTRLEINNCDGATSLSATLEDEADATVEIEATGVWFQSAWLRLVLLPVCHAV